MSVLLPSPYPSSPLDRGPENVRAHAVVITELELSDIERQVLAADLVERAHDAALEDTPIALNRVCVDRADHVLACAVAHVVVRVNVLEQPIAGMLIGGEQRDFVADCGAGEGVKGRNVRGR